ncbi:MAG: ABC transporter substrate-binding protein [Hyphomicrobiales bacterium]|nr:ABC transporter substrate-binding protein [Hyphomicrobiales bacterium]
MARRPRGRVGMSRLTRRAVLSGAMAAAAWAARPALGAATARVVTLGGDVTEIVYALGAGGLIVGRDSGSLHPAEAAALPDLGYFRNVGAEGVLSLAPTLVLATASAGPPETLRQIAAAGPTVIRMPDRFTGEALIEKVRIAADALKARDAGDALASRLSASIADAEAAISRMPREPRTLFLLSARDGAPMAAGRDTAADGIIALARGVNVFSAHYGYKPISLEAAAAAAPQAIVMMDHTLTAMGGVNAVANHPALSLTPAAREKRVIAREGQYMLGFGPRLPEAMKDLAAALRAGPA